MVQKSEGNKRVDDVSTKKEKDSRGIFSLKLWVSLAIQLSSDRREFKNTHMSFSAYNGPEKFHPFPSRPYPGQDEMSTAQLDGQTQPTAHRQARHGHGTVWCVMFKILKAALGFSY